MSLLMIPYLPYISIASSRAAASRVGGRATSLSEMFLRKQHELLASLSAGELMDHPASTGTATERHWIDFLNAHLPQRYGASSAFIIDADGRRSRQIDVAVYDRLYTPPFFAQPSGLHLPAESVYAVFEIKQVLGLGVIVDAARNAASVRMLRRTSAPIPSASGTLKPKPPPPILAGILAQR